MAVSHFRSRLIARLPGTLGAAAAAFMLPCGLLSADAQSSDGFFNYPGTALRGNISAEVKLTSITCRELCLTRSGCVGFDSSNDYVCRLYSRVTDAQESENHVAGTRILVAGYRPPTNPPAPDPGPVQEAAPSPEPVTHTTWVHNGSLMKLIQNDKGNGDFDVEIIYEHPRQQLLGAGIRPGSTLFIGSASGGVLSGRARLRNSRCGVIEYDVSGQFDPMSPSPFTLRGAAPRRGGDCQVRSWTTSGDNANLRFDPSG